MKQLLPFISINAKIFPKNKAIIPAMNDGTLFGQGIFTTLKVKQGVPLFFAKHQNRLLTGIKQLGFDKNAVDFPLEKAVINLIERNQLPDCALRLTILKHEKKALVIIHAYTMPTDNQDIAMIMVEDTRDNVKNIKTINRIINILALQKAISHGADDALFVTDGKIIEGTNASVFSLNKTGQIITPLLNGKGLESISKNIIKEQTSIFEEDILKDTKGPLVLVNCLRIRNVKSLNGKTLLDATQLYEKLKTILENAEDNYLKK